jgi:hypothetical protein
MGGGGGGSGSLGDISELEARAKEILTRGQSGRHNVFISFAYEDRNIVEFLRGQAKNKNIDLEFNDHSVKEAYNSERAEYIRLKLRERISRCSTTIVYLSSETAVSEWVNWEVTKSIELGKRVIAIHSGQTPPPNLPAFIKDHGIKVVSWSQLANELSSE